MAGYRIKRNKGTHDMQYMLVHAAKFRKQSHHYTRFQSCSACYKKPHALAYQIDVHPGIDNWHCQRTILEHKGKFMMFAL